MEFKYCDGQNGRTTSSPSHPLSAVAYVSRCPLLGCEFVPEGFSGNVLAPKVFQTVVPVNTKEAFQRELEKEEIKREIIATEMALGRRRELEEEVRREMASKKAFEIPMQRSDGISFNNNKMFGGSQFHLRSQFHCYNRQASTHNNKDKLMLQARPNVDCCGGKRKAVSPAIDDSGSLRKKVKQEWSCELCQIIATSEKGLNDHVQGKKHKAKASRRTHKIGLDSRLEDQTLHPLLTTPHTGKLESREEDQVVHNSKGLGGSNNQNETITSNETKETNGSSTRKKVRFVNLELNRNCHTEP